MKASVHREALASALSLLTGATSTDAPILGSVLLTADPATRSVTAVTTNLKLRIATTITAAKITDGGSYALPVAKLLAMVRSTESETVQLGSSDGEGSTLKISGGCTQYRLVTGNSSEFPADFHAEPQLVFAIQQDALIRLFEQVAFAQSNDSTRFVLMSTHLVIEVRGSIGHITATATNGRVVARATTSAEIISGSRPDQSVFKYIVPSSTVNEIIRVGSKTVDDYSSTVSIGRTLRFALRTHGPQETTRDIIMTSTLLEASYPDTTKVMAFTPANKFRLPVDSLRSALDRVSLVCTPAHPGVEFNFNAEELKLGAESPEYGSAKDIAVYSENSDSKLSFKLLLSPALMQGMLRPFAGDTITFHIEDADKTVFISLDGEKGFRGLILPMYRVNGKSAKTPAEKPTAAAA